MSAEAGDEGPAKRRGRAAAVDCARGAALIGMALYHLSWDLADFRLITPGFPFSPPMRLFSHVVASAFLALVGLSLALAHQGGLNWPAFWRRLGIIAGAAALVTLGSFVFSPGQAITFGILHCIAAASLLALPFVRAPASASLAAGAAAIVTPLVFHSKLLDPHALLWLGLGEAAPHTLDWRPLLPWAGVVLIGLGLARLPGVVAWLTSPARWRAKSPPARALAFAGRHSLAVYLIHQPVLIGLVYALTTWGGLAQAPDHAGFLASCQRACVAGGRASADCEKACQCVADVIERSGESDRLDALDETRRAELKLLADACRAP